jgi:hypothetical protein
MAQIMRDRRALRSAQAQKPKPVAVVSPLNAIGLSTPEMFSRGLPAPSRQNNVRAVVHPDTKHQRKGKDIQQIYRNLHQF